MTVDRDMERRVAAALRTELDRQTGPHPAWSSSPAAERVAKRATDARWPRRLLAVAAILAIGGGAVIVLSRQDEAVAGCPDLGAYARASSQPMPSFGEAPDVMFPPVAPDAAATTGLLEPGQWAILADAKGPMAQMRIRDVRACGRLPDVRSAWDGGTLYLARVDARVLRDDPELAWLGAEEMVYAGLGGTDIGRPLATFAGVGLPFGVPGVDRRTSVRPGAGFEVSSDVVLDVPPTDLQVVAYPATLSTRTEAQEPIGLGWIVRQGRTGTLGSGLSANPTPGATATTRLLRPGDVATIVEPGGAVAVKISDVDQVDGYPGRPADPGFVYVEARLSMGFGDGAGVSQWRAVDGEGNGLPFATNASPDVFDPGMLQPLLSPADVQNNPVGGWFVVEAPPSGEIRLEMRIGEGTSPAATWVIREP